MLASRSTFDQEYCWLCNSKSKAVPSSEDIASARSAYRWFDIHTDVAVMVREMDVKTIPFFFGSNVPFLIICRWFYASKFDGISNTSVEDAVSHGKKKGRCQD